MTGTWQPFETAPRDRTVILVYRPDAGVFTALYTPALAEDGEEDEDNYCWFTVQGEDIDNDPPTHWRPLPSGPDTEPSDTTMTLAELHDRAVALRWELGYPTDNKHLWDKWLEECKEFSGTWWIEPRRRVPDEAGDVLIVLCAMLEARGLRLEDAAAAVVAKLEERKRQQS